MGRDQREGGGSRQIGARPLAKLIIFSIVLMSFLVPMRLATAAQPRRALRRVQVVLFAFIFVWALMCLYWYPLLVTLE